MLFLAELVTLLEVRGLITWHVAIGLLLVPPALLKTGSTGWRVVRYYAGSHPYRRAGPPPLLLRLLGPLVVGSTLAVLVSGVALILVDRGTSVAGLDLLVVHKAAFVLWAAVTGVHVLGRLVPALQLVRVTGHRVPGSYRRAVVISLAVLVAAAGVVATMSTVDLSGWHVRPHRPGFAGQP